ncbi:MAG: DUF2513 domain-containing protein [Bacilli bacterium]|nr:DUF2513 domain-containing protein [Bacilli bacterium]MBP3920774.1 DUF2513 domain-containing protein [Bacilli bacterium]
MKINNNCARKILLEIEKIPNGENLTVAKLHEKISEFSIEDVLFIVTLFNKEHYLTVLDKVSYDDNDVLRDHKIKCLTEKGYKALDLIRDDTWNLMKEKINNFDELSIFTIFNIANKIINVQYNELFGLPKDLLIDNTRW